MKEYGKLCTLIYDLDKKIAGEDEIELYTKHIKNKNDEILEPMCGSGRFYIPLLKKEFNITGFDSSIEMLNSCRNRSALENLKCKVYNCNLLDFNDTEIYEHVLIPIGSLSLILEHDELIKSLDNIYRALKDDGFFIFSFLNLNNRDSENTDNWQESMKYPIDDKEIICKYKSNFDIENDIIDMKLLYELKKDGELLENEYQDFPMKLYKEEYLINIIKDFEFRNIELLNREDTGDYFSIIKCQK